MIKNIYCNNIIDFIFNNMLISNFTERINYDIYNLLNFNNLVMDCCEKFKLYLKTLL